MRSFHQFHYFLMKLNAAISSKRFWKEISAAAVSKNSILLAIYQFFEPA